ncbi:MAG TPA: penicillin-binding protein 2 [Longimicrobiaceae bacterium]|nr:penicillin-binding protein 2 [Longimicrobiaceae bacterium]
MKLFLKDPRKRRTHVMVFAITFVMTTLLTAFFATQVVAGHTYEAKARENRLRPIVIPAPRGTILDRNGDVVATSITSYTLQILPSDRSIILKTLQDLAPFVGLAGSDVQRLINKRDGRPHDLLEVTDRATYSQAAALEERRAAFPNVLVVERPQRYYPAGAAIGHIVGYVTEITRQQLKQSPYKEMGYRQGRLIGQAGIEKQYERSLSGTDGARYVEVDARGRVVNPTASITALDPEAGEPLRLTIDVRLQEYIHQIFPDTMKGAVVAMVPSSGEILALYSHPTYDPNAFVGRIPADLWRALNTDPRKPLLNRTITAQYPPASTFKTATAVMGVRLGLVTKDSHMPIPCTGGMAYAGRYAKCWWRAGHGSLDLAHAIEKSCNVYFYQLGIRIGLNNLAMLATRIGFGHRTGIDLPAEISPIFPKDAAWYKSYFGFPAQPSDVMSLAIGQGPNSQTVLNMASFYAAIAGNGRGVTPHLVRSDSVDKLKPNIDTGLSAQQLTNIWAGLQLVTEEDGTAVQSSLARYKLYGKTGTAQNPQGPDHGWFVGFAGLPGGHPEIVVAVIVEHGLHGDAAAPLASKVANFYLDRVHRHPFDPAPTWGERIRAGKAAGFDPAGRILVPFGEPVQPQPPAKS